VETFISTVLNMVERQLMPSENNMRMKDDEILPLKQRLTVREMAAHLPRKALREKPIKKRTAF
jgi:hypothetical protein